MRLSLRCNLRLVLRLYCLSRPNQVSRPLPPVRPQLKHQTKDRKSMLLFSDKNLHQETHEAPRDETSVSLQIYAARCNIDQQIQKLLNAAKPRPITGTGTSLCNTYHHHHTFVRNRQNQDNFSGEMGIFVVTAHQTSTQRKTL